MMIGLFVALSLVGSLWSLIGIGDAVVLRDRGQEAADAVALSAATINARGMNAISVINIISLLAVGVYLILCLAGDILLMLAAIALIPPFTPAAAPLARAAMQPYKMATKYEKTVLKKALPALGTASTAVAIAAPWLGTAAGAESADHYKDSIDDFAGVAIGPSNFPISKLKGEDKATPDPVTGKKPKGSFGDAGEHRVLGLPVSPEKNQTLCVRAILYPVRMLTDWLRNSIPIPIIGGVVGGWIAQAFESVAMAPAFMHCSYGLDDVLPPPLNKGVKKLADAIRDVQDLVAATGLFPAGDKDLWNPDGATPLNHVKKMAYGNGDTHFLVLGWAREGSLVDDSNKKVMLASQQYGGGNETFTNTYDAQAEFYYDCGERWSKMSCNGPSQIGLVDVGYQNAIYSIAWKARLKRSMNIGEVLARVGFEKAIEYFTGKAYRERLPGSLSTKGSAWKDALGRTIAAILKGSAKEGTQQGRIPTGSYH